MSAVLTPEAIQALAQGHLAAAAGSPQNAAPAPVGPPATVASGMLQTPPAPQAPPPAAAPVGAPLTAMDKYNATEEAREAVLRKKAQIEDNATVFGGIASPGQPQVTNGDGTVENADNLAKQAIKAHESELAASGKVTADTKSAVDQGTEAVEGEANARAPADRVLAARMEEGYDHVKQVEADVAKQSQESMDNYKSVNDEMHKLAVSQPTDLFGQAGVNKTLGSIAIFLGGAGMNGNGPNAALAQLNSMADRTVAAQKAKFEMLSRVGQGDQTLFGMLQQRLQNTAAAENTMKSMALEAQKSMVQQATNQYAGPKARANGAKIVADMESQQLQLQQRSNNAYLTHAGQAVAIASQHQTNKVTADAAFLKEASAHQAGSLEGFVGWVPTKAEHTRLTKIVGGARNMVAVINNMESLAHVQGGIDLKTAAGRKFLVDSAAQFLSARQLLETGTRLEEGELKMIAQFVPDLTEAGMANFIQKDPAAFFEKLQQIRTIVTGIAARQVGTAAPRTTAFDSQDPLWGQYNPRTYRDPLIGNGEKNNPKNPMAAELKDAPKLPEGMAGF